MVHTDLRHHAPPLMAVDRNQVQLALAIADDGMVRSLLTDCTPAIVRPQQLGTVRITLGVPLEGTPTLIDGVLDYEQIWCGLAESPPDSQRMTARDYQALTRCQGKLQTLGFRLSLAETIALLSHGGFQEVEIQRILQLPWDGWHRSWWYPLSPQGQRELPFQRWFRARAYGDGTYTLQYRDHYFQDAPPYFRGLSQRVPIAIAVPGQSFGDNLKLLREAQHSLQSDHALLLAASLSPLEEEGFIRQGISLYALQSPLAAESVLCDRCFRVTTVSTVKED
ncbi:hypothetical protein [Leptolyngbya sp. PCC 6406]|uniref:hypothetical protein n=1 Tax=Leptolyngbya sp. PCC 6406 TaxID=1173264 RepID=UPI0002ACF5E0|nr:hypothetical protein [Leptolyngbya sp. PCC 6406]